MNANHTLSSPGKSTRSKVLRHCSGVDSDTRNRILLQHAANPLSPQTCAVYCILPDIPTYFWHEVTKGVLEGEEQSHLSLKLNIYTRLGDTQTVLIYLKEALQLKPRVLILAAVINESVSQMLDKFPSDCMILLLSEEGDRINSFFIGSPSFQDGCRMGTYYLPHAASHPIFLLSSDLSPNIPLRIAGFCSVLRDNNLPQPSSLFLSMDNLAFRRSGPAYLASCLSPLLQKHPSLCLYLPFGIPRFSLTLTKLKSLSKGLMVLCHDMPPDISTARPPVSLISCSQQGYLQGLAAAKAAERYLRTGLFPPQKHQYIPSFFSSTEDF